VRYTAVVNGVFNEENALRVNSFNFGSQFCGFHNIA